MALDKNYSNEDLKSLYSKLIADINIEANKLKFTKLIFAIIKGKKLTFLTTTQIDSILSKRFNEEKDLSYVASWHVEDILGRAEYKEMQCNYNQAKELLRLLSRNHDAEIGVNWDVIDYYLAMVLAESLTA